MSEPPPPTSPLNYATPYPAPPAAPARPRGSGRLLGWVVFVLLAFVLVVLVHKSAAPSTALPLSGFVDQFRDGNVRRVTIRGDQLSGQFVAPTTLPAAAEKALFFHTELPAGTAASWAFTSWLLENRGQTVIEAENDSGLLTSFVLPLVPWVLIFGFLWFFLARYVRRPAAAAAPGLPQRPIEVVIVNREGP